MTMRNETELARTLKEWYAGDSEINEEWRRRAVESWRFYTGIQQWDPDTVATLRQYGMPALVINRILSTVHVPAGYQRRNRSDITLFPKRGGTRPVAEVGSQLIKHTISTSRADYEMSDWFLDGCVCGKGWLSLNMDWSEDPIHGDIVVAKESVFDILEDQTNTRYDVNKGQRIVKSFWMDKRGLELRYPKIKAREFATAAAGDEWDGERRIAVTRQDGYEPRETQSVFTDEEQDNELQRKLQFLLHECWWTEWENLTYAVEVGTGIVKAVPAGQERRLADEISMRGLQGQFAMVERPGKVLYKATLLGDMVLEHTRDPLNGITRLPFIRFCPYWADGYAFGLVDNMKGPQEELNKRRSQTLHSANRSLNGQYKANMITPDGQKFIEEQAGNPGAVWDKSKFGGDIEEFKAPQLDTAHYTLAERAALDIKEVSGVNSDLLGTDPNASESGKARMIRQEAGLMTLEVVFDNFDRCTEDAGILLWEMIRRSDVFSEEEITSIVQEANLKQFTRQDMFGRPFIDLSPMKNWTTGKYGVQVGRSANSPTLRMAYYDQLLEAVKVGIPIPPQMILEMSDIPNKEQILDLMQEQQQQQAMLQAQGQLTQGQV
jgi:hypothetical protein